MARHIPNAPLFLALWLLAGAVTIVAALTQSELAARIPRSGGPYQYLRVAYGDVYGFMYGWANFVVVGSGAVAAVAYVCASYLTEFVELPTLLAGWQDVGWQIPFLGTLYPFVNFSTKLLAAGIIVTLTAMNARGIGIAATFQTIASSLKFLAITAVIIGILCFHQPTGVHPLMSTASGLGMPGAPKEILMAMTLAMAGAFWAYEGWGTITYLSSEVYDPRRNIPRAILLGTGLVVALYALMNYAYTVALPIEAIGNVEGDRVATAAMQVVFGTPGALLISAMVALSTFDCTNATIITNGRVYHTMAHEKVFLKIAGHTHARHETPHISLWLQCAWALVLLFTGSFDLLISMYVFVNWLMYGALGVALFIVRRRGIGDSGTFRVPWYPWLPLIFVAFAGFYIVWTLIADVTAFTRGEQPFLKSVGGLVLLSSGLPLYYLWKSDK